ncbi:hypothetical protein ACFPLB_12535, partial [Aquamicrobium segne]
QTWVKSQWKNPPIPGQISAEINSPGFKSTGSAATILFGIKMVHMIRKRQAKYVYNSTPSLAGQFKILVA